MKIATIVYKAVDATMPTDRFMAFIIHKANGQQSLLPVYFRAETADGARNRAIAFWDDEKAKKVAQAERGRKLGLARRKNPPGGC